MRAAILAFALLLATATAAADSGWLVGPYHATVTGGAADITIDSGGITETARENASTGNEAGVRFVAWGGRSRVALAGGASIGFSDRHTEDQSGPMADADIMSVSLFGGIRAGSPLVGSPRNGLYPFAFAGLSLVSASGDARTQTVQTSFNTADNTGGSLMSPGKPGDVAPFVAAGLEWDIAQHLALTLDYRVQHYDIESDVFLLDDHVSLSVDASAISLGIAWRDSLPGN